MSEDVTSRALAAFLGLAIGDALGTTIEFERRDTYEPLTTIVGGGPFNLERGEWTDDTTMALCLAESLIATGGRFDPADVMQRYVNWWKNGHNSVKGRCFDIGIATSSALSRFLETGDPFAGDPSPEVAGNGALMRLAPAVIVTLGDQEKAVELAVAQTRTTHAAPQCIESSAWMAEALHKALHGAGIAAFETPTTGPSVDHIARGDWRSKDRANIQSGGYSIDTLEAAVWSVGTSASFKEAVLKAANLGGDSDTVAAVTGQFAGAIWGMNGIPQEWLEVLAWRPHLETVGRALIGIGLATMPTPAAA